MKLISSSSKTKVKTVIGLVSMSLDTLLSIFFWQSPTHINYTVLILVELVNF
jgi:hypothetical protein